MNNITFELLNLLISFTILGFILMVSLTHYPSFKFVDKDQWQEFHSHHSRSISLIIMPLMLAELALAIYFTWKFPTSWIWISSLVLVIGVWLNTFLQAVPLHNKLGGGKDLDLISKLNQINWIRTILWATKAGFLLWAFNS